MILYCLCAAVVLFLKINLSGSNSIYTLSRDCHVPPNSDDLFHYSARKHLRIDNLESGIVLLSHEGFPENSSSASNYPRDFSCELVVHTPIENAKIMMRFEEFYIPSEGQNCGENNLYVFDSNTAQAKAMPEAGGERGLCRLSYPKMPIYTTNSYIFIAFLTSSQPPLSLNNNHKPGFRIVLSAIHETKSLTCVSDGFYCGLMPKVLPFQMNGNMHSSMNDRVNYRSSISHSSDSLFLASTSKDQSTGYCIMKESLCDNVINCDDGKDEDAEFCKAIINHRDGKSAIFRDEISDSLNWLSGFLSLGISASITIAISTIVIFTVAIGTVICCCHRCFRSNLSTYPLLPPSSPDDPGATNGLLLFNASFNPNGAQMVSTTNTNPCQSNQLSLSNNYFQTQSISDRQHLIGHLPADFFNNAASDVGSAVPYNGLTDNENFRNYAQYLENVANNNNNANNTNNIASHHLYNPIHMSHCQAISKELLLGQIGHLPNQLQHERGLMQIVPIKSQPGLNYSNKDNINHNHNSTNVPPFHLASSITNRTGSDSYSSLNTTNSIRAFVDPVHAGPPGPPPALVHGATGSPYMFRRDPLGYTPPPYGACNVPPASSVTASSSSLTGTTSGGPRESNNISNRIRSDLIAHHQQMVMDNTIHPSAGGGNGSEFFGNHLNGFGSALHTNTPVETISHGGGDLMSSGGIIYLGDIYQSAEHRAITNSTTTGSSSSKRHQLKLHNRSIPQQFHHSNMLEHSSGHHARRTKMCHKHRRNRYHRPNNDMNCTVSSGSQTPASSHSGPGTHPKSDVYEQILSQQINPVVHDDKPINFPVQL